MVKDCPFCGLVNPPSAQQCDCGYEFESGAVRGSPLTDRDRAAQPSPHYVFVPAPAGCVLLGLLLVIGSNGVGLVLAGVAFLFSLFVSFGLRAGPEYLLLLFGGLSLVFDVGVRRQLLRVDFWDRRAGSLFVFLPLWLFGLLVTAAGTVLAGAANFGQ